MMVSRHLSAWARTVSKSATLLPSTDAWRLSGQSCLGPGLLLLRPMKNSSSSSSSTLIGGAPSHGPHLPQCPQQDEGRQRRPVLQRGGPAGIGETLRQAAACRPGANTDSLLRVSRVITQHSTDLNVVTLTSAVNLLARSARTVQRERRLLPAELGEVREAIELLERRIAATASSTLDATGLALCAHGLANLRQVRHCPLALSAISAAAAGRTREFEADQLATIVSAFAKAEHHAPALFDAVRRESLPRLGAFSAQGLSSLAHAFSRGESALLQPTSALLLAVEKESASRLSEFSPQGLSNVSWALVKSGNHSMQFLDQVKDAALPMIGRFGPNEITIMLGSFATAGALPALRSLLRSVQHNIAQSRPDLVSFFSPQGLSTYAWAAAKAKLSLPAHTRAVANEVMRRDSKQFHNQDLIRLAWSFAESRVPTEPAFRKVLAEMLRRFQSLEQSELLGILMTLAAVRTPPADLSEAVADKLLTSLASQSPLELCNTVWACGRLEWQVPGLSARASVRCREALISGRHSAAKLAAAASATRHSRVPTKWTLQILCGPLFHTNWINHMEPSQMVQLLRTSARSGFYSEDLMEQVHNCPVSLLPVIAWSMAKLSFHDQQLMGELHGICTQRLTELTPSQGAMLAYACATLAHKGSEDIVRRISRQAAMVPEGYSVLETCQVLWSQAVLDCLDGQSAQSLLASLSDRHEQLHDYHLVMLYQVHLARLLSAKQRGAEVHVPISPDLLSRAEAAWSCHAHKHRLSQLHDNVLQSLHSLGAFCTSEWRTPDGLFSIDIAVQMLTGQGRRSGLILIDVDGPDHYLRPRAGKTPESLGATQLRRRLLAGLHGLHVVSLPYWEWEALGGDAVLQREYLQRMLETSSMATPS